MEGTEYEAHLFFSLLQVVRDGRIMQADEHITMVGLDVNRGPDEGKKGQL